MPTTKLTEFLDASGGEYSTIRHDPVFTAQELASATHVAGREVAKAVVVSIDGKAALAVVPSPSKVDLQRIRDITGAKDASLLTERFNAGTHTEAVRMAYDDFARCVKPKVARLTFGA